MAKLDSYGETRAKINANLSLSSTGKKEQIQLAAKDAYEAIHGMRDKINYQGHRAQLNQQIDNQLSPKHSMEEKLLRQLRMGEIRRHLANLPDERILKIYNNATSSGDLLTVEAIEQAPPFLFDGALLGQITKAEQETRRAELNPSLTGQIGELERCDSATRLLFTDAETILSTENDTLGDIASGEVQMGT